MSASTLTAGNSLPSRVRRAVSALAGGLWQTPLLLLYCALGLLSGLVNGGLGGLGLAVGNYLLLAIYVVLIYLWTQGEPTLAARAAAERAGASTGALRRDLALIALVYGLDLGATVWFWNNGLPMVVIDAAAGPLRAAGWDRELASTVANGLSNTIFNLVPALVLALLVFRLRPGQVALRPRHLGLGVCLVLLGIAFAGLGWALNGKSTRLWSGWEAIPVTLAVYAAKFFVNGIPEEFIFRGVIMGRLLPWLRNPRHALVLSSVLFVFIHVPSLLARQAGGPWWLVVFGSLVSPGAQPTGLVWAYLCYRTRSIWPGVLWHTSGTTLGGLFL